jgi:hypothetical protein
MDTEDRLTFEAPQRVILSVTLSLTINDTVERLLTQSGIKSSHRSEGHRRWDDVIILEPFAVFIWLGAKAVLAPLTMNFKWVVVHGTLLLMSLGGCGCRRYKQTTFS